MNLFNKFSRLLKKRKVENSEFPQQSLKQVIKDPGSTRAHLKLAENYQKKGEKQRAISEYLLAAEIFAKNNQFTETLALYKQVTKLDSSLDHVFLKMADIYRKIGFLGDAFAQYKGLINYYEKAEMKGKALEVMGLMAELDPRKIALKDKVQKFKEILRAQAGGGSSGESEELAEGLSRSGEKKEFFDLGAELEAGEALDLGYPKEVSTVDKFYGFDGILKELKEVRGPSKVYPDFNYHMGIACREMGFFEDALKQFQRAFDKGQNSFEAAKMMGLCFKEIGRWEEACTAFRRALEVDGAVKEKKLEVQYELGLVYKEMGRTEEAFQVLKEITTINQDFRDTR
ncbi:MAG: tetratricopeptide repeat protein [Deltaproteobacteria bacterium]|nr:tetratricopeptide repeat protein [Deltaproteobacteria bacterium]